jgi:hypothetical protein
MHASAPTLQLFRLREGEAETRIYSPYTPEEPL